MFCIIYIILFTWYIELFIKYATCNAYNVHCYIHVHSHATFTMINNNLFGQFVPTQHLKKLYVQKWYPNLKNKQSYMDLNIILIHQFGYAVCGYAKHFLYRLSCVQRGMYYSCRMYNSHVYPRVHSKITMTPSKTTTTTTEKNAPFIPLNNTTSYLIHRMCRSRWVLLLLYLTRLYTMGVRGWHEGVMHPAKKKEKRKKKNILVSLVGHPQFPRPIYQIKIWRRHIFLLLHDDYLESFFFWFDAEK